MRKKRRRFVFRALALLIGLLLAFAAGELVSTGYAYLRHGTASVSELHALEKGNVFLTESENPYLKTLFPHPYLGFVHNKTFGGPSVNNVGLYGGRDMPLERRTDLFTILVIGGSVAAQFAQLNRDGERALEKILNDRYDFGGKQVMVMNGADGKEGEE